MRQGMTCHEARYKKTLFGIGLAMCAFWVLFYSGMLLVDLLDGVVYSLGFSARITYVIARLIYSAVYLLAFMLPVAVLKLYIRRVGVTYTPMQVSPRLSPYLPFMIFAVVLIIRAASYVNYAWLEFPEISFPSVYTQIGDGSMEPFEIILGFICTCLVPGFCEEFLFRGAILGNCLPFGRTNAVIISSILFALMHENLEQMLYTFIGGILFGYVYVKTESLWNCVILHMVNNFFSLVDSVILENIPVGADVWIPVVEGIVSLLGIISVAVLVIRFFSKKERFEEGIYQKSYTENDSFARCPIETSRAVKLFFAPTMILFLLGVTYSLTIG